MKEKSEGATGEEMQDLITPAEAARVRKVTRSAITDLMKRGRLKIREIGGRQFLFRNEVENFTPDITGRPPKVKAARVAKSPAKKGSTK